jgi:hypothetical protein
LQPRHYSRRTEQTYCHWVKRFIYFHNVRHPAGMAEMECFFSAEKRRVFLLPPLKIPAPYIERLHYGHQNPIQLSKSNHCGKVETLDWTRPLDWIPIATRERLTSTDYIRNPALLHSGYNLYR